MALRYFWHAVAILQRAARMRPLPESAGNEVHSGLLFFCNAFVEIIEASRAMATDTDQPALIPHVPVT